MSRFITPTVRIVFGLAFLVFGLNGFFHFIQPPGVPPKPAIEFVTALMGTGYLMAWVKGTEVIVGALLLSNRFVPLALTVLAPIMLNIVAFHLLLDHPSNAGLGIVLMGMHLFLAWSYRAAFKPMLKASVSPAELSTHKSRSLHPASAS